MTSPMLADFFRAADPAMVIRCDRAAAITTDKRAKLNRDVQDAVTAVMEYERVATVTEDAYGPTDPRTLDAYKALSEACLTVGRRARILAGLPRGG